MVAYEHRPKIIKNERHCRCFGYIQSQGGWLGMDGEGGELVIMSNTYNNAPFWSEKK
jgi:hypothetical protein